MRGMVLPNTHWSMRSTIFCPNGKSRLKRSIGKVHPQPRHSQHVVFRGFIFSFTREESRPTDSSQPRKHRLSGCRRVAVVRILREYPVSCLPSSAAAFGEQRVGNGCKGKNPVNRALPNRFSRHSKYNTACFVLSDGVGSRLFHCQHSLRAIGAHAG